MFLRQVCIYKIKSLFYMSPLFYCITRALILLHREFVRVIYVHFVKYNTRAHTHNILYNKCCH